MQKINYEAQKPYKSSTYFHFTFHVTLQELELSAHDDVQSAIIEKMNDKQPKQRHFVFIVIMNSHPTIMRDLEVIQQALAAASNANEQSKPTPMVHPHRCAALQKEIDFVQQYLVQGKNNEVPFMPYLTKRKEKSARQRMGFLRMPTVIPGCENNNNSSKRHNEK